MVDTIGHFERFIDWKDLHVRDSSQMCHQINTITEEAAILLFGRFYYEFHLIIHLLYKYSSS